MDRQDKSSLGEEIAYIVESALENCDFQKLSQSIGRTVNKALDQVGKNVSQAGKIISDSAWKEKNFTQKPVQRDKPRAVSVRQAYWERYAKSGSMNALAVFMMALGAVLLVLFGVHFAAALFRAAFGGAFGLADGFALGATGFLTAAGAVLGGAGVRLWGYTSRFKRYVARLEGREYCDIEDFREISGRSRKYILRDLKRMIRDKLFKQGHLDQQGTCLMVTDRAYEQYRAALWSLRQRQQAQETEKQQKEAREDREQEGEAGKVIRAGNQYLAQIRRSKEAISRGEISGKLSRMELVIGKIFERVRQHPELANELGRFMDYYLPTTVKLLGAYEEMDAQPVQGPNIANSKKEIEDTLDIINQAFENLLDSFFEDVAWDISTDISVFKTMLAQEGLTKGAFDKK